MTIQRLEKKIKTREEGRGDERPRARCTGIRAWCIQRQFNLRPRSFSQDTLRYRRHLARAVHFVRLTVAVLPVPLLALPRAVPYAAAQLARPVRVLSAPGAAAELLQECFDLRDVIFSDFTSNIVAAFLHPEQCYFEHVLRESNVFLEAAHAVEKTQRDVVELVNRPVFGRRSEHKRNSGLGAEGQVGDTNDEVENLRLYLPHFF